MDVIIKKNSEPLVSNEEIVAPDILDDILKELTCDWSSTKTLWLKKVKGCHASIARFMPRELKRELETRSRDEITMEVAMWLARNG